MLQRPSHRKCTGSLASKWRRMERWLDSKLVSPEGSATMGTRKKKERWQPHAAAMAAAYAKTVIAKVGDLKGKVS